MIITTAIYCTHVSNSTLLLPLCLTPLVNSTLLLPLCPTLLVYRHFCPPTPLHLLPLATNVPSLLLKFKHVRTGWLSMLLRRSLAAWSFCSLSLVKVSIWMLNNQSQYVISSRITWISFSALWKVVYNRVRERERENGQWTASINLQINLKSTLNYWHCFQNDTSFIMISLLHLQSVRAHHSPKGANQQNQTLFIL